MRTSYFLPISFGEYFALSFRDRDMLREELNDLLDELKEMGVDPTFDER